MAINLDQIEKRIKVILEMDGVDTTQGELDLFTAKVSQLVNSLPAGQRNIKAVDRALREMKHGVHELSPELNKLISKWRDHDKNLRKTNSTLNNLKESYQELQGILAFASGVSLGFGISQGVTEADKYNNSIRALAGQTAKYGYGLEKLEQSIRSIANATTLTDHETIGLYKTYERGFPMGSLERAEQLFGNLRKAVGANAQEMEGMQQVLAGLIDQYPELEQSITRMNTADRERLQSFSNMAFAMGDLNLTQKRQFDDYIAQSKQMSYSDQQRLKDVDEQLESMNQINQSVERISRSIGDTLMPMFVEVRTFLQDAFDVVESNMPKVLASLGAITAITAAGTTANKFSPLLQSTWIAKKMKGGGSFGGGMGGMSGSPFNTGPFKGSSGMNLSGMKDYTDYSKPGSEDNNLLSDMGMSSGNIRISSIDRIGQIGTINSIQYVGRNRTDRRQGDRGNTIMTGGRSGDGGSSGGSGRTGSPGRRSGRLSPGGGIGAMGAIKGGVGKLATSVGRGAMFAPAAIGGVMLADVVLDTLRGKTAEDDISDSYYESIIDNLGSLASTVGVGFLALGPLGAALGGIGFAVNKWFDYDMSRRDKILSEIEKTNSELQEQKELLKKVKDSPLVELRERTEENTQIKELESKIDNAQTNIDYYSSTTSGFLSNFGRNTLNAFGADFKTADDERAIVEKYSRELELLRSEVQSRRNEVKRDIQQDVISAFQSQGETVTTQKLNKVIDVIEKASIGEGLMRLRSAGLNARDSYMVSQSFENNDIERIASIVKAASNVTENKFTVSDQDRREIQYQNQMSAMILALGSGDMDRFVKYRESAEQIKEKMVVENVLTLDKRVDSQMLKQYGLDSVNFEQTEFSLSNQKDVLQLEAMSSALEHVNEKLSHIDEKREEFENSRMEFESISAKSISDRTDSEKTRFEILSSLKDEVESETESYDKLLVMSEELAKIQSERSDIIEIENRLLQAQDVYINQIRKQSEQLGRTASAITSEFSASFEMFSQFGRAAGVDPFQAYRDSMRSIDQAIAMSRKELEILNATGMENMTAKAQLDLSNARSEMKSVEQEFSKFNLGNPDSINSDSFESNRKEQIFLREKELQTDLSQSEKEKLLSEIESLKTLRLRFAEAKAILTTSEKDNEISQIQARFEEKRANKESELLNLSKERLSKVSEFVNFNQLNVRAAETEVSYAQTLVSLFDNLAMGVKASADMRMVVADNIGRQISQIQIAVEETRRLMNEELQSFIESEEYKNFSAAERRAQLKDLTTKYNADILEQETKMLQLEQQRAETLKAIRDGYVGAIGAMTAGTGMFAKVMIDQNKNLGIGVQYMGVLQSMSSGGFEGDRSVGLRRSSVFSSTGFLDGPQSQERQEAMWSTYNDAGLFGKSVNEMTDKTRKLLANVDNVTGAMSSIASSAYAVGSVLKETADKVGMTVVGEGEGGTEIRPGLFRGGILGSPSNSSSSSGGFKKFYRGGLIPGSYSDGDKYFMGVDGTEMVLNPSQQQSMAQATGMSRSQFVSEFSSDADVSDVRPANTKNTVMVAGEEMVLNLSQQSRLANSLGMSLSDMRGEIDSRNFSDFKRYSEGMPTFALGGLVGPINVDPFRDGTHSAQLDSIWDLNRSESSNLINRIRDRKEAVKEVIKNNKWYDFYMDPVSGRNAQSFSSMKEGIEDTVKDGRFYSRDNGFSKLTEGTRDAVFSIVNAPFNAIGDLLFSSNREKVFDAVNEYDPALNNSVIRDFNNRFDQINKEYHVQSSKKIFDMGMTDYTSSDISDIKTLLDKVYESRSIINDTNLYVDERLLRSPIDLSSIVSEKYLKDVERLKNLQDTSKVSDLDSNVIKTAAQSQFSGNQEFDSDVDISEYLAVKAASAPISSDYLEVLNPNNRRLTPEDIPLPGERDRLTTDSLRNFVDATWQSTLNALPNNTEQRVLEADRSGDKVRKNEILNEVIKIYRLKASESLKSQKLRYSDLFDSESVKNSYSEQANSFIKEFGLIDESGSILENSRLLTIPEPYLVNNRVTSDDVSYNQDLADLLRKKGISANEKSQFPIPKDVTPGSEDDMRQKMKNTVAWYASRSDLSSRMSNEFSSRLSSKPNQDYLSVVKNASDSSNPYKFLRDWFFENPSELNLPSRTGEENTERNRAIAAATNASIRRKLTEMTSFAKTYASEGMPFKYPIVPNIPDFLVNIPSIESMSSSDNDLASQYMGINTVESYDLKMSDEKMHASYPSPEGTHNIHYAADGHLDYSKLNANDEFYIRDFNNHKEFEQFVRDKYTRDKKEYENRVERETDSRLPLSLLGPPDSEGNKQQFWFSPENLKGEAPSSHMQVTVPKDAYSVRSFAEKYVGELWKEHLIQTTPEAKVLIDQADSMNQVVKESKESELYSDSFDQWSQERQSSKEKITQMSVDALRAYKDLLSVSDVSSEMTISNVNSQISSALERIQEMDQNNITVVGDNRIRSFLSEKERISENLGLSDFGYGKYDSLFKMAYSEWSNTYNAYEKLRDKNSNEMFLYKMDLMRGNATDPLPRNAVERDESGMTPSMQMMYQIPGFATGGIVPNLSSQQSDIFNALGLSGRGTDTVLSTLTPGEIVLNKVQIEEIKSRMQAVSDRFAMGAEAEDNSPVSVRARNRFTTASSDRAFASSESSSTDVVIDGRFNLSGIHVHIDNVDGLVDIIRNETERSVRKALGNGLRNSKNADSSYF